MEKTQVVRNIYMMARDGNVSIGDGNGYGVKISLHGVDEIRAMIAALKAALEDEERDRAK